MRVLLDMVRRHRAGELIGIPSVCSAHPLVLAAALQHAQARGGYALIEPTSNQVNQDGGYTGWRPAAFRDLVWAMADEIGLQRERILLGGDHLGPDCWQSQPAQAALERATTLVREYVSAGFRKIHLDCSVSCGDDPRVLADDVIAQRNAALCAEAEDAWRRVGGDAPVYVIGSRVPTPNGPHQALEALAVTEPQDVRAIIAAHHTAFLAHGLEAAWERVIGLVVQPGIGFDHDAVIEYVPEKARLLSGCLARQPHLVFEAHSTDYQRQEALAALVRDHFAILKVGSALTFALREAIWALDRIEREWLGEERSSKVRETLLTVMRADPRHWNQYYHGEGRALELKLEYSLSDRIRYYWQVPAVAEALSRLEAAFNAGTPPLSLLRQYLPSAYEAVRREETRTSLQSLVIHRIREVLVRYSRACDQWADRRRGTSR